MNIGLLKKDSSLLWEGIGPDGIDGTWKEIDDKAEILIQLLEKEDYENFGKILATQLENYLNSIVSGE